MTDILDELRLRHCIPQFVLKIYEILEMKQHQNVLCWENDSEIHIKDTKQIQTLLGMYFRHSKLSSFVRQLNMYGFHKIIKQDQIGLFFVNEYFKRGRLQQMIHIKRKKKQRDDEPFDDQIQKYKLYIQGNLNILYDSILQVRNNNPTLGQQFNPILDILNLVSGRRTTMTLSEQEPNVRRDYILDRSSVCSIERDFKQ